MGMNEFFKTLFMNGYATVQLTFMLVLGCIFCTTILAFYLYMIYRWINRKSFYNRNFNLSLVALAIITAAIILTIQSNIIVSLGMVGALSIVRFRTAIKDPLDLVFLFWSISIGIICGAGFALIAVVVSLVITVVIYFLKKDQIKDNSRILVINANTYKIEAQIIDILNEYCSNYKISAKTVTKADMNMAIEVKLTEETEMLNKLMDMEEITTVSYLEHDDEVTV